MNVRRFPVLAWAFLLALTLATPLCADPAFGKLSGVVVDPAGIPQMGATVALLSEDARAVTPLLLHTNDRGVFTLERLRVGAYSVRVTLPGFLPALERHVRIEANLTTLMRVELDSVFSSLDKLRRQSGQTSDTDDWAWVLRTSTATRPVLRYADGEVEVASAETASADGASSKRMGHGRVEFTAGARRPGSISNMVDAPSSAFAYEQKIGRTERLLFAGESSIDGSTSTGLATIWLPSGQIGRGPQTTLVLRRTQLGEDGPVFRGVRMDFSNQLALGERIELRYGTEYLLVGVGRSASALRPRGQLNVHVARDWEASFTVAPRPFTSVDGPAESLQSALLALDAFPAVFLRNGRPVLESGWHDELALEHHLGRHGSVTAALFRDRSRHTAVFGRGGEASADFFQDSFSRAFAYDGGESNAWGGRVAYRQKFSSDWEADVVYAWAGALAPEMLAGAVDLRSSMATRQRHSFAARVSGRAPRLGTQIAASYKWVSGTVVSRQDPYGEALYMMDPYLNLRLRQPLPSFFLPAKVEALADFRNLLAQGYVPVNTPEGQLLLVPSFRSFRGGFSFQF